MFEGAEAKAAIAQAALTEPKVGSFIIVKSDKGRMRRLHFLGACHRRPGEHYFDYAMYDDLPDASLIDARCRQCFPPGKPLPPAGLASDIESADESDTSSSSGASATSRARSPTPVPVPTQAPFKRQRVATPPTP